MKFLYTFLLLLSIFSIVYSDSCDDQKKEYEDCIDAYKDIYSNGNTKGNYKTLCSKNCKKFFNDPDSTIPKCSDGSSYRNELKDTQNIVKNHISLVCATDEEGENCPNTQALIDRDFANNKKDSERIADKTCKSKLCTDVLIEIHRTNIGFKDYALDMVNKLNSQECKNQQSSSSSYRSVTDNQSVNSKKNDDSDGPNWLSEIIMYIIIIIVLLVILFLLLPKSCTKCVYTCFDGLLRSSYKAKTKQNTTEEVV